MGWDAPWSVSGEKGLTLSETPDNLNSMLSLQATLLEGHTGVRLIRYAACVPIKYMAIRHNYTLFCETVLWGIDGLPTFVNIFSNLVLFGFPGWADRFLIVVGYSSDSSVKLEVSLESAADGVVVYQYEEDTLPPAQLEPEYAQFRPMFFTSAAGAEFPQPGLYYVVVRSDGQEIHRQPFGVLEYVPPQEAEDEEPSK